MSETVPWQHLFLAGRPTTHPKTKFGEERGTRLDKSPKTKDSADPSCARRPPHMRSHTQAAAGSRRGDRRPPQAQGARSCGRGPGCGAAAQHVPGRGLQGGGRGAARVSFALRLEFRILKQYQGHRELEGCQVPFASLVFSSRGSDHCRSQAPAFPLRPGMEPRQGNKGNKIIQGDRVSERRLG